MRKIPFNHDGVFIYTKCNYDMIEFKLPLLIFVLFSFNFICSVFLCFSFPTFMCVEFHFISYIDFLAIPLCYFFNNKGVLEIIIYILN